MPWKYEIKSEPDSTTTLASFSDAPLGDFLSRPLNIVSYEWTPGAALFHKFNPWKLFFKDADVLQKINRYRNLRCCLKLKVLLNGNPFYYGRALLSYNPYVVKDSVTVDRQFLKQDIIQASQKPHILLDPCTSQGGLMHLPFIWPENFLDITSNDWVEQMGEMIIHDFDVLNHANNSTSPITVSIFAWAEDVSLAVPTTAAVNQSSSEKVNQPLDKFGFPQPYENQAMKKYGNNKSSDEFVKDGLFSKPASAVASAANALTMIPMIAPYAKATAMVATKLGQVARLFGYSRPQVLTDTTNYVPRFMGNVCNSDTAEPLVKLSLDSKNELSIDTRVMGLGGEDELTINSIAQRPSYWQSFTWPQARNAEDILFSCRVTPAFIGQLTYGILPVITELHPTALAFATAPFSAWQGTIKFRFNIVCSEYHRGRLRVVYNPNMNNTGPVKYNQVYSTIIDISEDRDFEYEVKWANMKAFLPTVAPEDWLEYHNSSIKYGTPVSTSEFDNGTLSVYVVNELASPSDSASDVQVQVWVSAGDDYAVSIPAVKNLNKLSYFTVQSDMAPEVMATSADTSNAPTSADVVTSFGTGSDYIQDDNQYLVYQGEKIVSFRELLRRYQFHSTHDVKNEADSNLIFEQTLSDFPFYRGFDPNGQFLTERDQDPGFSYRYNFCTNTLLNYLTPAYALRRGGLRHKAVVVGQLTNSVNSIMVAREDVIGAANSSRLFNLPLGLDAPERAKLMQETVRPTLGGAHVTISPNNPVLEYETPFYTLGQRFVPARDTDYFDADHAAHTLSFDLSLAEDHVARLDKYVSVAEDFQLGLFLGAPIMYSYKDPRPFSEPE